MTANLASISGPSFFSWLPFCPSVTPHWPLRLAKKHREWKMLAIWLSKYAKTKFPSPLPFPGKTWLLCAFYGLFLAGGRAESPFKESESKFDTSYCSHKISGQLFNVRNLMKKIVLAFFNFSAIGQIGYFKKILIRFGTFGCFSGNTRYMW